MMRHYVKYQYFGYGEDINNGNFNVCILEKQLQFPWERGWWQKHDVTNFSCNKKYIPYSLVIGKGYISYLKLNQLHQVPVVADVCKTNKRNNKEQ